MCENGICPAAKRKAVYWSVLCISGTVTVTCTAQWLRVIDRFLITSENLYQNNLIVLTFWRIFCLLMHQSPESSKALTSLPPLSSSSSSSSVQCHACAVIQTAKALDRRREEGRRLYCTAPGRPQQPRGGGWAFGAPGSNIWMHA